jgi:hypothetical protein
MATGNDILAASFDDLGVDVLANILAFLKLEVIMHLRRVSKRMREAVKMAIVPISDFVVNNVETYNAMVVMARAVPNLQKIRIDDLRGRGHKYNDGEDPDEEYVFADHTTCDIGIISNFSKLRILEIGAKYHLGGTYHFFRNSFPCLQQLTLDQTLYLNWDLEILSGMPLLKELVCTKNFGLTGNINSLRVLKETLEKVIIIQPLKVRNTSSIGIVEGNLMDLADFPRLKELDLDETDVTGDIRDIGECDFSSLERLRLPKRVFGGKGYELQRIDDATDLINVVCLFKKQRQSISIMEDWYVSLSKESPDWYSNIRIFCDLFAQPPFYIRFVQAGSRIGYRWETKGFGRKNSCEVIWLDPEPDSKSSDYATYIEELQEINSEVKMYRGFHQPPTEEEYSRLYEEHRSTRLGREW